MTGYIQIDPTELVIAFYLFALGVVIIYGGYRFFGKWTIVPKSRWKKVGDEWYEVEE
jgi:hypothetical protein